MGEGHFNTQLLCEFLENSFRFNKKHAETIAMECKAIIQEYSCSNNGTSRFQAVCLRVMPFDPMIALCDVFFLFVQKCDSQQSSKWAECLIFELFENGSFHAKEDWLSFNKKEARIVMNGKRFFGVYTVN